MLDIKQETFFITGGAGFIGSSLAEKIAPYGKKIIIFDNFNDEMRANNNIRSLNQYDNIDIIKGDILDFQLLSQCIEKKSIVIHLAAIPYLRYSFIKPVLTNTVNTNGTLNVLKASIKKNVKKVINISSSSVYGNDISIPTVEEEEKIPISIYGASKLLGEIYCKIYYEAYGLDVVSLRYFTVYGPKQRPDMAIHKFINQIFNKEQICIYGDGNQTRDFTYIDDIIDGTIKAALTKGIGGESYNLGGGGNISVNNLIKILHELLGDFNVIYESTKQGDVRNSYADISKAKNDFGYSPKIRLREGIIKFIEWYKKIHDL